MRKVTDLGKYKEAKAVRKRASADDDVTPIFSWKDDPQLLLFTQSKLIRSLAVEVLERLNVNPASPQYATAGTRISINIDEGVMHREGLSRNDVFRCLRDTISRRTARTPEQNFVYPSKSGEQLQISIYLP